jgi:hypothetical protein
MAKLNRVEKRAISNLIRHLKTDMVEAKDGIKRDRVAIKKLKKILG